MASIQIPENFVPIPFDGENSSEEFSMVLDGVLFKLRFDYSYKLNRWMLTLKTSANEYLFRRKRILSNTIIANYSNGDGKPDGKFFCVDFSQTGDEPTREDFGTGKRTRLYYVKSI